MYVKLIDNELWFFPEFVQETNWKTHTYKGSLSRHKAIEKILVKFRDWIISKDAMPLSNLIDAFIGILFGFNCNFSQRDIAFYTIWYLRGCKPLIVMSGENFHPIEFHN